MQTETDPKRIERRLIFLQSRDGMLDMFFGLLMLIVGINDTYSFYGWEEKWYLRYGIIILILPFMLGKFLITTPRLGYVKMRPVAGGRRQTLIIFLTITFIPTLLLFAGTIFKFPGFRGEQVSLNPIVEFACLVLAMSFVAWLIGAYSLFFVGLSLGFAWPVATMLHFKTIAGLPQMLFTLCLPGLIILIFGLVRLIRFLKSYPKENLKADYEPEH